MDLLLPPPRRQRTSGVKRAFTSRTRSTTPAPRKKKVLGSNFEPQHDALVSTVVNNTTGATVRTWKPDPSAAALSSKASEAAYKGWQSRRSHTPATPISASPPVPSPAPPAEPIQLPAPFRSLATSTNAPAPGSAYVPLPAGFGAYGLARAAAQPMGGGELDQRVGIDTWAALKQHYSAYTPSEDLMERAKLVITAEQESEAPNEVPEEAPKEDVPEPTPEKDGRVE